MKAKRIIFPFMNRSHVPDGHLGLQAATSERSWQGGTCGGVLTGSKFKFSQHGETGAWVSELYPHVARHVDKLCFIRGLHTDTPAHPEAVIQLHTGAALAQLTRPSLGAWPLARSGNGNQDLPGYARQSTHLPTSVERSIMAVRFCPRIFRERESTTPGTFPISRPRPPLLCSASRSTSSRR